MALQFDKTINVYGKDVTFESCYARIETMQVNREYTTFNLLIYSDPSTQNLIETMSYRFVPDISDNAINYHKQAYEYLKTLDEYKDAIDV